MLTDEQILKMCEDYGASTSTQNAIGEPIIRFRVDELREMLAALAPAVVSEPSPEWHQLADSIAQRFVSNPDNQIDLYNCVLSAMKHAAAQPAVAPSDSEPRLPHDITVGGGTFGKGIPLSTFVMAAQRWHRVAYPDNYTLTDEQKAENLRKLQVEPTDTPAFRQGMEEFRRGFTSNPFAYGKDKRGWQAGYDKAKAIAATPTPDSKGAAEPVAMREWITSVRDEILTPLSLQSNALGVLAEGFGQLSAALLAPSSGAQAAGQEDRYTLDEIADACIAAEISDSKFESLSIALSAQSPASGAAE